MVQDGTAGYEPHPGQNDNGAHLVGMAWHGVYTTAEGLGEQDAPKECFARNPGAYWLFDEYDRTGKGREVGKRANILVHAELWAGSVHY